MNQLIWSVVLSMHAVGAALWWWLSVPSQSGSTDWWVNEVLPWLPIAMVVAGLVTRGRASEVLLPPLLTFFPIFWMVFAVSFHLAFPQSSGSSWAIAFFLGVGLAVQWARQYRFSMPKLWPLPFFVIPALWAGWALPDTQRAPLPTTHPAGGTLPDPPSTTDTRLVKLSKEAQLHPDAGRLVMKRGDVVLTVQPLLAFQNRSPDRAWASGAPPDKTWPTTRRLTATLRDGARWSFFYTDEDRSVLDVVAQKDGPVDLDARSRLKEPIWSQQNAYAEITVRGHKKLTVAFSPMPQKRVELPPAGAPQRFAALDAQGVLHVYDSTKQDLGPYVELASGTHDGKQPLGLVLYDGDEPCFQILMPDWAAQASTATSPTAGAPIPQNAIQLTRGGQPENAPALVSFSLAASDVGRGSRTVAHADGVYRDRITILPAPKKR